MTAVEFEEYVTNVVSELDFLKGGVVLRNHRFAGIRQPGQYEIDIALTTKLGGTIEFLLVVECKNWNRPVDRPVVQKLAQTRDAIAAHKAAIASPLGFTSEAVEVARANGIALWVLSKSSWRIIMGVRGSSIDEQPILARQEFLRNIGFKTRKQSTGSQGVHLRLVDFLCVTETHEAKENCRYDHSCFGGSAYCTADNVPGIDARLAATLVADELGMMLGLEIPSASP